MASAAKGGGTKMAEAVAPVCFDGLGDGVEDGDLFAAVFKDLAAFAGGDAGDDLGAVVKGKLRVLRAEAAGDALDQDFGVGL